MMNIFPFCEAKILKSPGDSHSSYFFTVFVSVVLTVFIPVKTRDFGGKFHGTG